MLHVWKVSGEKLTAIPVEELTDVRALKHKLEWPCGATRFRQRILCNGENLDEAAALHMPMDVQLVLLSCSSASTEEVEELIAAAGEGDSNLVESILSRPQAPDLAATERGLTPLIAAARHGHVETARLLLEAGADVDKIYLVAGAPEACLQTALSAACRRGHIEMAQLLLDAGSDPYEGGLFGNPIFQACRHGHLEILQLVLAEENPGRDWRRCEDVLRAAGLEAYRQRHWEICQLLLTLWRARIQELASNASTLACCFHVLKRLVGLIVAKVLVRQCLERCCCLRRGS